jgi:hypothetical protein
MAVSGIISVSGKPGLYKVISQTKNGLIAESLIDAKRIPVYASQKVSALEEISIYTYEDDIPLTEVFEKIYEKTGGKPALDHKSDAKDLRTFLAEVIENFDQERVYNSDLKKLFQWFNLLIDKGLLTPEKKEDEADDKKTAIKGKKATAKKTTTTKPKKATTMKKPTPKASAAKSQAKSTPRKVGGGK